MPCKTHFIKFTAKLKGYHLSSFHILIFYGYAAFTGVGLCPSHH